MQGILTPHGRVTISPVQPRRDAPLLHGWLTSPHAFYWQSLDASVEEVEREYLRITDAAHEAAWLLRIDDHPAALVETYDPSEILLDGVPSLEHAPGDVGMHILVSPPRENPRPGFTNSIFAATMRWLCDHRGARRVVVEPDAGNQKILAKNALAGFRGVPGPGLTQLTLGSAEKTARVQRCTAERFRASALAGHAATEQAVAAAPAPHLSSPAMTEANRQLMAKAIREFVHERLLTATRVDTNANAPDTSTHAVQFGPRTIEFRATPHRLEHLSIDPSSLRCTDSPVLPMLSELIAEASDELRISPGFLHTYLEEIQATLAARARALHRGRPSARQLSGRDLPERLSPQAQADQLQFVEASMVEGHPSFIANSGRGGMSEGDLNAWAPELSAAGPLVWLAASTSSCVHAVSHDLPGQSPGGSHFWAQQLGQDLWETFTRAVEQADGDPKDYVPIPVHPWQWNHRLTTTFASDIASGKLLYVGTSQDLYRPQQSLRTFFNHSRPSNPYVKTAVAVRNMGFLRGLSATYMESTPAINDWLQHTIGESPEFVDHGVQLLREIATVGYVADVYHRSLPRTGSTSSEHVKMLAGLWRESPIGFLEPTELAVTLASTLHVDGEGNTVIGEWIEQSGLTAEAWLRELMNVYLWPVIHAMASHSIAFMPHGENVILRLRRGVPVGAFFKDLGEEVAVVHRDQPVPEEISRIQADHGEFDAAQRALSIHTDVLDGVLRHLAALMADHSLLSDADFWKVVRYCVEDYEASHPGTLEQLPLLSETFRHSCLNRLQLRNPLTMVELGEQNGSLIYAGDIANPLAE
ncbi:GNAT family N-acetyltransferase [Corynebacterium sp.]|uniref:GNAT family N-acetyltransferase n=1 Tax=Corynebacterium sp. TaxID=1720 RepID=UPI002F408F3F